MTCKCGHDRDFFHQGRNGCTWTGCGCPSFHNPNLEPVDDHLTDLMDAIA